LASLVLTFLDVRIRSGAVAGHTWKGVGAARDLRYAVGWFDTGAKVMMISAAKRLHPLV
jgi:hypothetical protein